MEPYDEIVAVGLGFFESFDVTSMEEVECSW
jgi:hypothetical protein